MRDGGSVAVSLRTVGYVTVSVWNLKSVEEARCKNNTLMKSGCSASVSTHILPPAISVQGL